MPRNLRSRLLATSVAVIALPLIAHSQEATLLERLEVEAASNDILVQDGYVAESGRVGSKIDTPLDLVPQAISTVTVKQLEDQKPRTLLEALNYTPGVRTGAYGFDPRFDAFFIRGFEATYGGIFRDGLRQYNSPTGLFRQEIYGLEGINILKGPASALYGASNAGGLVDLMTKRPTEERFREVEVQLGTNDRYQGNFDFSGPITDDGTLLYRLTGVARDSETALPGFPDDRLYIAPALTWQPTEDTKLTILGEYMDSTVGGTAAFYNDANGITDLYSGDPTFNDFDQQQARIGYEFEHRINEVFTARQNLRYTTLENDLEYAYWFDQGDPNALGRAAGRNAEQTDALVIDNQLLSEFTLGGVEQRLLVGLDYGRVSYDQQGNTFADIPPEGQTIPFTDGGSQTLSQVGVYVSDQVNYGNVHLTLGGRYDWLDSETSSASGRVDRNEEQASWRAGLAYDTPWGLVPYVNYTTSFAPNVGILVDGSPANPTVGEQKEIGVKYRFPNINAVVTASLFDITQDDAVVFEVVNGFNQQVNRDLRSRGFEIEATASLDNGINLIASYAYVDMEIRNSLAGFSGNQLNSTPHHTFSIWGDYTIDRGFAEGLGIGAGVRYVGESFGDDANTIENDDHLFVDAALSYDFGARNPNLDGVTLQVNAKNLLDERGTTCSSSYCYREEGRSVVGSLRYRF
jgi:iron complex outermembrane recepter protein